MADEIAASAPTCPWCSQPLAAADAETCSNCGAQLIAETDAQVPGLTAIDAEAIVRATHPAPQRRSRLLSWISGEYDAGEESPAAPGSVSPPDPDVRREMLRLELQAEVANLQAEAGLVMSEAEVEAREQGLAETDPETGPAADEPAADEPAADEPAPTEPERA
jgi:hypothetical protein